MKLPSVQKCIATFDKAENLQRQKIKTLEANLKEAQTKLGEILELRVQFDNTLPYEQQVKSRNTPVILSRLKLSRFLARPEIANANRRSYIRRSNKVTLREAIAKVTRFQPLSRKQILRAVKREGYRFSGKNPMNCLNILYAGGFTNFGGKFQAVVNEIPPSC